MFFQCIAIVDEYYPQIYEYLKKGLNCNIICKIMGICPTPGKTVQVNKIFSFNYIQNYFAF